ncbi:MAG: hypothetical protein C4575_12910 [Desulforudis sp.]|jgi:hypothetical protein|nr:MAG: hypothetical protein C4575_12910 [Desulforudis sp.]
MQAKVREDSEQRIITSCSGREFVKGVWRDVPAGFEAEAQHNPFLETREPTKVVSGSLPILEGEPISETVVNFETKPAVKRKSGGKHD